MTAARHVTIHPDVVGSFARRLATEGIQAADDDLVYRGSRSAVANFILLTDALNFCFWSDAPWEVEYAGRPWTRTLAMVAGVRRGVDADPAWLTAGRWAAATAADVAGLFAGRGTIPLPELRLSILRETGRILRDRHGGEFTRAVEAAGGDATALADLLAAQFPSFADSTDHPTGHVPFLKRAQICAADLHRAWAAQDHGGLAGLGHLTVFADYRLPQLFRHEGLLTPSPDLAGRIDRGEHIPPGCAQEVEIRAATIVLGDLIVARLRECGVRGVDGPIAAYELDYELWRRAREPEVTAPHHRTETHFY